MAQVVLQPGTFVGGHFRVDSVLGRGTYGIVYKATDPAGGAIALKVLSFDPDIYSDGADVFDARVEREIKALRRLNSSSVVRLHDWGMHGDAFYLAMEFVEGRTLARIIRHEGRLSPTRVVALARAILTGLADAHAVGVVHRDLKPENIMVNARPTGDEEIRILDFGVARLQARSGNTFETEEGASIFGTPAYMAPEQGLGQVLPQSDLYAVATIMFEMLVGRLPFDDPQPLQVMIAKLQQPVPPLLQAFGIPPDLVAVVIRALERQPTNRYFDALSMYRALANARLDVTHPEALIFGTEPPANTPASSAEPMQFAPTAAPPLVTLPMGGPNQSDEATSASHSEPTVLGGALRQLTALRPPGTPRARRLASAAALLLVAAGLFFIGTRDATPVEQPSVVPDGSQGGLVRYPLPVLRPYHAASPLGGAIAKRAGGNQ